MAPCLRLCTLRGKVCSHPFLQRKHSGDEDQFATWIPWIKCCLSAQRKIQKTMWNHPRNTNFIYMLAAGPLYTVSFPAVSLSTLLGIWKYFSNKDHYQRKWVYFSFILDSCIHSITASLLFAAPVLIPTANLLMRDSNSTPETITSKY